MDKLTYLHWLIFSGTERRTSRSDLVQQKANVSTFGGLKFHLSLHSHGAVKYWTSSKWLHLPLPVLPMISKPPKELQNMLSISMSGHICLTPNKVTQNRTRIWYWTETKDNSATYYQLWSIAWKEDYNSTTSYLLIT